MTGLFGVEFIALSRSESEREESVSALPPPHLHFKTSYTMTKPHWTSVFS